MPQEEPYSAEQIEAIRAALCDLLEWNPLRRSPQLRAFLSYIVEASLQGDEASIKAYAIAVDVFGRAEDFDPQADPIVRVQARRLRSLLGDYYATKGAKHGVKITLPRGRYVPEFVFEAAVPGANAIPDEVHAEADTNGDGQPPTRKHRPLFETVLTLGGLSVVFLGLSLIFWPNIVRRDVVVPYDGQPLAPLVVVEEFENLTNDIAGTPLVAGLAVELVTDFNQFPHITARYGRMQAEVTAEELESGRPVFVLSGVVRRTDGGVQYGGLLSRADADAEPISVDVNAPVDDGRVTLSIDDISRLLAMRLASPRGVLHAPARAWLAGEGNSDLVLAPYPCMVVFAWYEEAFDPDLGARVRACALAELESETRAGEANAMLATLAADEAAQRGTDLQGARELLDHARDRSALAVEIASTSGFVWARHGHVAAVAGNNSTARDRYNTAMQLNPADVGLMAHFAMVMAQTGNWTLAIDYADTALAVETASPPRFHVVPALWELRNGEYAAALSHAHAMTRAYPSLGAAVLVAIGGQTDNSGIIDAYLPRLLADQRYRRLGIMPALWQSISDPEVLRELSNGISRAGVPLERLANPF